MHPQISIVIVTYHTTPLTRLCLWSLAMSGLKHSEVIMIDNACNDDFADNLAMEFSFLQLTHNQSNEGFGKACNRGFRQAKGDIILFLNPDTIVPPDFEEKIIRFFNFHPKAGAMGPKMIDATGIFLNESKRNFPSPAASFVKFSGFENLIPPNWKKWHYYAKHIPENKCSPVQVLSGAFMAVTRETMKITGGFDPRYFLYAEDIDLSLEVATIGNKEVWYNPEIKIVHFKSQTTKKSPLYSSMFYASMLQFYHKHLDQKSSGPKTSLIVNSIKFLSVLSSLKHKLKQNNQLNFPIKLRVHPASSRELFNLLSQHPQFKLAYADKEKTRGSHLLLSSQSISIDELISNISNSCKQT
ncbi:MAG: glycosyltransferase family 2 protein, partial [Prolixibacteraceae bacterium]